MPIVSTKAIVLNTLKYGDTSLIVKCFTEEDGLKSYLIKGIVSSSSKSRLKLGYFQPLTLLELSAKHTHSDGLNFIKEARVVYPYKTIFQSVIKQSIVLFLSEILSNTIQEEERNQALYDYLESSLIWLDSQTYTSNFHLLFLLNLSRFLGFYPDTSDKNKEGFSLLEGKFTNSIYDSSVIAGNDVILFKKLLDTTFDTVHTLSFHKSERQVLLKLLMQYFTLHLSGFKHPQSLSVLETVFG